MRSFLYLAPLAAVSSALPSGERRQAVYAFANTAEYKCFGPTMDKFPKANEWLSFEQLWQVNEPEITTKNGGNQYNTFIKNGIEKNAQESSVDKRLILAIIMQESTGGVHTICTGPKGTDGDSDDCGLMQLRGATAFQPNNAEGSIHDMIHDGIFGAGGTPGYSETLKGTRPDMGWVDKKNIGGWINNPFAAAHIYNVGDIDSTDLTVAIDENGVQTKNLYAQDIAARLMGWNGWNRGTC